MRLSVIVCTRNRAAVLTRCLDSIAVSLAAVPAESEIVVVDNASTDDTAVVVGKWAESCGFPVQFLQEPKRGLSAARNCALRAAKGDLLVFTDDDCRLAPDYAANALRHDDADSEPVLRGGRVAQGDPSDLPLTILTDTTPRRWDRKSNAARRENLGNALLGCNMALRRAAADRLGPFDERLGAGSPIPGGEDIDYVFRAYLAGIPIAYEPDLTVFHYHGRKRAEEGRKLLMNYSIGGGALYAKYLFKAPGLCRQFAWDIKDAARDVISGKNTFMQDLGFSHVQKVAFNLRGAFRYWLGVFS